MRFTFGTALILGSQAVGLFLGMPQQVAAQGNDLMVSARTPSQSTTPEWSSARVQHLYGMPEIKANAKGTLTVDTFGLSFATAKGSSYRIPRSSVLAVSSGNERVEMWGMTGRLLRMAIPKGGGLPAAGVMNHKVNMLSVEFKDSSQAYHAAVFLVPAGESEHVLSSFAEMPPSSHGLTSKTLKTNAGGCGIAGAVNSHSVLLTMPAWNQSNVPSSYRDLVYEHTIEQLQKIKGVGHVYREGEVSDSASCPQYVISVSVTAFKQGNQVERAMIGPLGAFVGTTQMSFTIEITEADSKMNITDQLKATLRGDGESRNVADSVAKSIAKHYASEIVKGDRVQTSRS